jgi:chromosome partitioning protein
MTRILAIANQKGGVAKTTTAINLGASLAVAERHVLLIDLDPQGNATSGVGINRAALTHQLYDGLVGKKRLDELIHPTPVARFDIIPSTVELVGAEIELVSQPQREGVLRAAIAGAALPYDFILIDCPPSLGLLTLNALTAADGVLIPMQCEYYAMEGLGQLVRTVGMVRRAYNPRLELAGIVLTMFDGRNNLARQVAAEVRGFFPGRVFDTVIPRNVALAEAPSHGKPVLLYHVGSAGAQAYLRLAKELLADGKESAG